MSDTMNPLTLGSDVPSESSENVCNVIVKAIDELGELAAHVDVLAMASESEFSREGDSLNRMLTIAAVRLKAVYERLSGANVEWFVS